MSYRFTLDGNLCTTGCGEEETTAFRLWWRLVTDINSILRFLHCANVSNITDVSEVHAGSNFWVEVCKLGEFICMYKILYGKNIFARPSPLISWNIILYVHRNRRPGSRGVTIQEKKFITTDVNRTLALHHVVSCFTVFSWLWRDQVS
jgi:hypothetical protein